jgi:hypothetical protein
VDVNEFCDTEINANLHENFCAVIHQPRTFLGPLC